ncbi:MAG: hypothetical protein JWP27_1349 [Flaviaesturariibacter sp.]|nr:hypothetical protein [Flaviaesturariibacter sp.]
MIADPATSPGKKLRWRLILIFAKTAPLRAFYAPCLLLLLFVLSGCAGRARSYFVRLPLVSLSLSVDNSLRTNEIYDLHGAVLSCSIDSTGVRIDANGHVLSKDARDSIRTARGYDAMFVEQGKWNLSTAASVIIVPDPGVSVSVAHARDPALVTRYLPYPISGDTRITEVSRDGRRFLRYATIDRKGVECATYAGLCNGNLVAYAYLTDDNEKSRTFRTMWENSRFED